jgi:ADP-dependent phosphofructokinase/glucokinase
MTDSELKTAWRGNYSEVEASLAMIGDCGRVVAAFNANIDAVVKVSGSRMAQLVAATGLVQTAFDNVLPRAIRSPADLVRGLLRCFSQGIAEEWLIEDEAVFAWARDHVGWDRMQMGGQAGIVANAMALCGVQDVLVHCASLPADQARLFLDLPNLRSTGSDSELAKAHDIVRNDSPMVHWILEFDGGDVLRLPGRDVTCPKSNRFIATYDPMNLGLRVDEAFQRQASSLPVDLVVLSGYHLLTETLPDGGKGADRVDASMEAVLAWRATNPDCLLHLEIASTQDRAVRRHILEGPARKVDSIGLNERETIDLLELLGDDELVATCNREARADHMLQALLRLFRHTGCPRLQLHMYGLYLTVQQKGFRISPAANRRGMQVAAVVAAGKAGTGALEDRSALLWAKERDVSDIGLTELKRLAYRIGLAWGRSDIVTTGIFNGPDFDIIAVPTILVEHPVTLVGMGDTISSVSLVAAR